MKTLKEFSRRGGLARAQKLTPERRREIASMGGKASAGKPRKRNNKRKKRGKKKTKKRKKEEIWL